MNNNVIYTKKSKLFLDMKIREIRVLRYIKSAFEMVFRITLIIALILTTITVITANTDKLLGITSYTVLSGSMEPTISTGSIIYTMKNLGYNLHDVITYKLGDRTVTHRIVGIRNNGEVVYITKGDANNSVDSGFVTSDKIIGKSYFSIPFIGKVSRMLKTPQGLFMAVFFPAISIIGYELWAIKKEIEKAVEKRILERIKHQGGAHTHSLWPESIS